MKFFRSLKCFVFSSRSLSCKWKLDQMKHMIDAKIAMDSMRLRFSNPKCRLREFHAFVYKFIFQTLVFGFEIILLQVLSEWRCSSRSLQHSYSINVSVDLKRITGWTHYCVLISNHFCLLSCASRFLLFLCADCHTLIIYSAFIWYEFDIPIAWSKLMCQVKDFRLLLFSPWKHSSAYKPYLYWWIQTSWGHV